MLLGIANDLIKLIRKLHSNSYTNTQTFCKSVYGDYAHHAMRFNVYLFFLILEQDNLSSLVT